MQLYFRIKYVVKVFLIIKSYVIRDLTTWGLWSKKIMQVTTTHLLDIRASCLQSIVNLVIINESCVLCFQRNLNPRFLNLLNYTLRSSFETLRLVLSTYRLLQGFACKNKRSIRKCHDNIITKNRVMITYEASQGI